MLNGGGGGGGDGGGGGGARHSDSESLPDDELGDTDVPTQLHVFPPASTVRSSFFFVSVAATLD